METTEKKYELTEETIEFCNRTLYRIKALKDFGDVEVGDLGGYIESESNLMQEEFCNRTLYRIKALKDFGDVEVGDLGGYIESESNLMQEGCAWVYGNAMVYGSARVFDNAKGLWRC